MCYIKCVSVARNGKRFHNYFYSYIIADVAPRYEEQVVMIHKEDSNY